MAGKKPRPATVEDFDEVAHDIVPDSRQVANTAAKLQTRSDLRSPAEPLIDGASDSGYSSRTAATANSTQSGPSGGKSPPVLHKLDMPKRDRERVDLARRSSSRKDRSERPERKDKDRVRPVRDENPPMGAYPHPHHAHAHVPRSSSKSRRRDSVRYYSDYGYDTPSTYYPPSTPVDPRVMENPYPYYINRPPVPDYPPSSPQSSRWPPGAAIEQYHASRPSGRPHRSNSYRGAYHQDRPVSFHGMPPVVGPHMYHGPPMYHQYDHGPPPASSAYANTPYSSSPSMGFDAGSYYAGSEFAAQAEYMRERSRSRTREPTRPRRSSVYGGTPVEDVFPLWDDGEALEQWASREPPPPPREHRESRGRSHAKPTQEHDEDYYKMPPPPPPVPKQKAQIHQVKRPQPHKSQTTNAVPSQRRSSRTMDQSMDMSEIAAALPDYAHRRLSREARIPERSHSLRDSRRSTSYHDNARGAQVAVENSRRRRTQQYYYEDRGSTGDLEDREREVERYQAQKAGRPATAMAPSTEALLPKLATGAGSDNGSLKSRSNSSRGSGSKDGESKNVTLAISGMTIGFSEESVAGKSINIRTGDTGGVHLNINGGRKPQQYLTGGSSYSSYTGGSGHRELEDAPRRPRNDSRSERSSRRTSRSSYGQNRYAV